jgi:hypothetical protein
LTVAAVPAIHTRIHVLKSLLHVDRRELIHASLPVALLHDLLGILSLVNSHIALLCQILPVLRVVNGGRRALDLQVLVLLVVHKNSVWLLDYSPADQFRGHLGRALARLRRLRRNRGELLLPKDLVDDGCLQEFERIHSLLGG